MLGIVLNLIGAQFIKSFEDGRECSIPLWSALPRNAALDFFPGTTPNGLISTVMILVVNLALFGLTAWILAHNPKMFSSVVPGQASLLHGVLLNLGAVFATVLILAVATAARVVAIGILFGFNSNVVDLMLPGTCSFLGYP
ncbi:MAG: hypothetical protein M1358_26060 [Chloroflexi bacterium]|nr:hypothetical protein [Chloroflexota bacterium]